jgi:preprotein translocase subunit SecG
MHLIITFLYILFILSAIVLVVVVLLQEGKGGGLTDALGTAGQQTFGVGAAGIHKFTGWCGAIFLVSALMIHVLNRLSGERSIVGEFGAQVEAPVTPPAAGSTAPATGGSAPAPADSAPAGGTPPVETPK